MNRLPSLLVVVTLSCLFAERAPGQDWAHWRGPNFDGSAVAQQLPTEFGREKNLKWETELPGPGAGTPVIFGEHVFVSSIDREAGCLAALCLDRETGTVLWAQEVQPTYIPEGSESKTKLHHRSDYASPSPTTDGERVVFFFGCGDLLAFDLDGTPLWSRNVQTDYGEFSFQWTFSASPTLFENRLFLPILQRDEPANGHGVSGSTSFLLAMDPATGKTLYKVDRPSAAVMESRESYATPIPYQGSDGRKELLLIGGDVITGHDPRSGEELWRWGTWNPDHRELWWRVVPSPVVGAGVALVCAPKRAPVYAVKLGGSGDLGESGLTWKSEGRRNPVSSDVPTPTFYQGKFYVLSDVHSALSKVDPTSGTVEWTVAMPGKALWRASPTGADGRIWCLNHSGLVAVIDANDGKVLAQVQLGEEDDDLIRSSIAVAHNDLFIRTNSSLFCIGGGG